MNKQKRITPAEVIAAYAKTGLRPCAGEFGDGANRGCPIIALAVAATGRRPFNPIKDWAAGVYCGAEYCWQFIDGFDRNCEDELLPGCVDGRACRAALLEAVPE